MSPKSQLTQSTTQNSYFKKTLEESGVVFNEEDTFFILTQEQALVVRDLEIYLKKHDAYPNNLQEFIKGMEKFCSDETNLNKMLSKTILQKSNELDINNSRAEIHQEPLMRLLLGTSIIQNSAINLILDNITMVTIEDDADTIKLRLLLNALRYLSYIQDATSLTSKLLDILEVASFPCQLEILYAIPEILPDSQNDDVASKLSKLLDSNGNLTGAIIDCLNALSLSPSSRSEVQAVILENLFSVSSLSIFPILLEFLTTDCKTPNFNTILMQIRNALDLIISNESTAEDSESKKIVALDKFRSCACNSKQLFEAWLNLIGGITNSTEHKPIDLIILIILYSSGLSRKRPIEAMFKKRIKSNLFKIPLLEKTFQKYINSKFLNDNLQSIIDIAASLIKMYTDISITEFVTHMYVNLFTHSSTNQTHRQDVIHNLILLTGVNDPKCVGHVLQILTELGGTPNCSSHVTQLMGLLEKLDLYDLDNLRIVFNLLCSIICTSTDETMSALKNDMHMLVRKLLSSSRKTLKVKGVISAILMAKYLSISEEDQENLSINESILNVSDLPAGTVQEAASLLELIFISSSASAELIALYYDELAAMLTNTPTLDKHLISWLFETVTNNFQDIFITETIPNTVNDIPVSVQYSLNSNDEVDVMISLNIAEHTIKPLTGCENNSITVLAPQFRLLRLIHYKQQNGDLATIDALLGCGIMLPLVEDFTQFNKDQMKLICDCLFHCINWFREIVSAFVTQKNKKLRQRVLERLRQLIQLEALLKEYAVEIPDYKPPSCYFYNPSLSTTSVKNSPSKSEPKIKQPRKKMKTKKNANESNESIVHLPNVKVAKKQICINFREVDMDIILLLKYPLDTPNIDNPTQSTQLTTLDTEQFKFLMKEFITKLDLSRKNKMTPNLVLLNANDLIIDSTRLLPYIYRHYKIIIEELKRLIKDADGVYDSQSLFTPEATAMKQSYVLVLESFYLIFNWSGFQNTQHMNTLKDCLKPLIADAQTQLNSVNRMITEFTNKLHNQTDICLDISSAVYIVRIMKSLQATCANPDIQKKITATSEKLLMRKWCNINGEAESGKEYFLNLEYLIQAYLESANTKTICGIVATLQTQCVELKSKEDYLPVLESVNRTSFYIFYRCLCATLKDKVQSEIQSLTNNGHLILWKTTAVAMQGLMSIVKIQETKSNLICFLKKSLGILKIFSSSGIPILEIMLRSKATEVLEIFKTMQTTTRFLHHLCCYSKLTKDCSLIAYVPQFKLTLETLVYRVKAALVANNCSAAFWMGNLKNRDLHGEDILSQSTTVTDDANDMNSDEELPADDSDTDLQDENVETRSETASEVFD